MKLNRYKVDVIPEYGLEMSLARSLYEARKAAGLTQMQLSERTGIQQCEISKMETAGGNPTMDTLKRLAAGLECKVKVTFYR